MPKTVGPMHFDDVPWPISATVEEDVQTGALRCVGLTLGGGESDDITTVGVRSVSVPDVMARVRQELGPPEHPNDARFVGRAYDLGHYRDVARVYLSADTAPSRAVATHFNITRTAAKKQVARCRTLGLLRPTTPGKAG